jgi:hypothetical protein
MESEKKELSEIMRKLMIFVSMLGIIINESENLIGD